MLKQRLVWRICWMTMFSSQTLTMDQNKQLSYLDLFTDNTLDSITISVQGVKDVFENLDRNKAHGPNHIKPCLLKEGVPILSKPLSVRFNRSVRKGYFPLPWKKVILLLLIKRRQIFTTSLTIFKRTNYWLHFSQASFKATAQPFNFYIHIVPFVKLLTQEKK